jgi:hypothetical protein
MRSCGANPFLGGAPFLYGSFAAFLAAFEHRVGDYPAVLLLNHSDLRHQPSR